MSDATERPAEDRSPTPDADAWATACAEDLAAERARRRAAGRPGAGSAAEELRRLADVVLERLSSLPAPLAGLAAQHAVRNLVDQARAAVEPVVERHPQLFDHLAAAGSELVAAYRAAVEDQERRWTRGAHGEPPASGGTADGDPRRAGGDGAAGAGGTEHIDLD